MSPNNERIALASVVLAGLLACTASTASPTCWTALDDTSEYLQSLPWTAMTVDVDDVSGLAQAVTVGLSAEQPWLAVSVSDPTGNDVCVQLDEVLDPNGDAWVTSPASLDDYRAYCRSCPERVSVGVGAGMYVLPSGDPGPPSAAALDIRAAVRDCPTFLAPRVETSIPASIRVHVLPLPLESERISADEIADIDSRQGRVRLDIVVTPGSIFYTPVEASSANLAVALPDKLAEALDRVDQLFASAGIRVSAARIRQIDDGDLLALQRGDHRALDRLHEQANACDQADISDAAVRNIPVVMAGCIAITDPIQMRVDEPDGFVPRIPDAPPPDGRAHGVFIRGRDCRDGAPPIDRSPAALGTLIAHELGHYLGLYHTVEADGGEDTLTDTGADNLMHWVSRTDVLSASQMRIIRRHPSIIWRSLP